jgi:SOS response regulatory protein OraA/RecX
MILKLWKKSEADRNSIVFIDNSVWGTISDSLLRTLYADFNYNNSTFEITEADAETIRAELQNYAWAKLVDWLARQEHSTTEVKEYLKRYKFHPSILEYCLSQALEMDYVNDERYCRLLIESLLARQKSPVQIKSKLIEKRLPSSLWKPILDELSSPEQATSILETQAEIITHRYASLERKARFEKCLTALYRKGFALDAARAVLNKLLK